MGLAGLFGSDVYDRYTAEYTWKSNQMAHAMMGFAGAMLTGYGARALFEAAWWGGALFVLVPIGKDVTDYFADRARNRGRFPPDNAELKRDGLADFFFWSAGIAVALLLAWLALPGRAAPWLALLAVLAYVGGGALLLLRRYVAEKRAFDKAGLPYYFRLPTFTGHFADPAAAVPQVRAFVVGTSEARHLLLSGPSGSGRTTLAVGIGCGLAVEGRRVRYVTSLLLAETLAGPPERPSGREEPHTLEEAECLVVDDLATLPDGAVDWRRLAAKRIVWVVSSLGDVAAWRSWIAETFGAPPAEIALVAPPPEGLPAAFPMPAHVTVLAWLTIAAAAVLLGGSLLALLFAG